LHEPLTSSLEQFLLTGLPTGTLILSAEPYRPAYSNFPALLTLKLADGAIRRCVVKIKSATLVALEVKALNLANRAGLPVPELLSDPISLSPDRTAAVLMSELPGRPLPWCGVESLRDADRACRLLLEAVDRLHLATDCVAELGERWSTKALPRHTLEQEYADTVASAGEWMKVKSFKSAVQVLGSALPTVNDSLVFSNGDYNPLNFLYDEDTLCGFVDFEGACFENPHIGFAKFLIWKHDTYGWGTGAMTGLVERYLYSRGLSRLEFAPFLLLRSLRHLVQEVSLDGIGDRHVREHILELIEKGLRDLG
jgi:aminoglycoside phosphotransferase